MLEAIEEARVDVAPNLEAVVWFFKSCRPKIHDFVHESEKIVPRQVAPMQFPMYTVPAKRLLEMTQLQPHEELKAALGGNDISCTSTLLECDIGGMLTAHKTPVCL